MIWQRATNIKKKIFHRKPGKRGNKTVEIDKQEYEEMKLYISELEQVLESNMAVVEEMKSSFLHNVYHEIRTPLNAILGFTSLLVHVDLSERKRQEYFDKIKSSSSDFLKIIDKLVDASLLETNQMPIETQRFAVKDMLTELEQQVQQEVDRTGKTNKVEVKLDIDKQCDDLQIEADKNRLLQVYHNLIDNALKFTKEGDIEIGYRKINTDSVLFFVKDSGIGLQDDTADSIFDAFVRYQNDELYDKRGLGLGLSICKGVVELMKGEIWVEADRYQGTIFNFALPLKFTNKKIQIPSTNRENVMTSF